MNDLNTILSMLSNLTSDELREISQRILTQLHGTEKSGEQPMDNNAACRKCGDRNCLIKYGMTANGKQRYRCKHCGTVFVSTSYSAISHTHCSLAQWETYICLMLQGASLAKCAKACEISVQTAFKWRHKIMAALRHDQNNRQLNGIVETDDMFFSVSYKGNHKNSSRFTMPRKPHKRGNDTKVQSYGKVCVLCAVERGGQSYGEVVGIGAVSQPMLEYAFKERLARDSVVVADKAHSIKSYFNRTSNELIQVAARVGKQGSPPEIKGSFHIQNVNNMHNRIRRFLRPYNGVSSKYLNHYINLFVWIENRKKDAQDDLCSSVYEFINHRNTYVRCIDIVSLPPIRSVA